MTVSTFSDLDYPDCFGFSCLDFFLFGLFGLFDPNSKQPGHDLLNDRNKAR